MSTNTASKAMRFLDVMSGEVKIPIGLTPREAIHCRGNLTVYRYKRETPATQKTPILLVYSLINRPEILDLRPGKSVVESLMKRGFDVYLLDWGKPDGLDQYNGLDVHLDVLLRTAVRQVLKASGAPELTMLGYCMGGTMAAMYVSRHPRGIKNLILLGAPFYFRSEQKLYQWGCNANAFDPHKLVEACGNAPAWAFDGFSLLRLDQKLSRMTTVYDNVDDPKFMENHLAMEQWINAGQPMPGRIYEEFIKGCFQQNDLLEGRMQIAGKTVDLSAIQCPVLVIVGEQDHLVPPETSCPVADVVADATVLRYDTGHVGLSVSGGAHKNLWPKVADWLGGRRG